MLVSCLCVQLQSQVLLIISYHLIICLNCIVVGNNIDEECNINHNCRPNIEMCINRKCQPISCLIRSCSSNFDCYDCRIIRTCLNRKCVWNYQMIDDRKSEIKSIEENHVWYIGSIFVIITIIVFILICFDAFPQNLVKSYDRNKEMNANVSFDDEEEVAQLRRPPLISEPSFNLQNNDSNITIISSSSIFIHNYEDILN